MIEIIKVKNKKELKRFIDFPHTLYKGVKQYVPELFGEQKKLFNQEKNPFFKHSKADFFIAYKDGVVSGRIVAIKNNNYIKYHVEKTGFFGFFECINDEEVADALFKTAYEWVRAEGVEKLVGPENYTINESCGILTEGFEYPPVLGMPYNLSYYKELYENFGFRIAMNLSAYRLSSLQIPSFAKRSMRISERQLVRNKITIRPINMKDFDAEIGRFHKIYNASFKENWGFVPLTEDEFRFQADGLKQIADPELVLFAEKDGEVIGFITTLPDYNQLFIKIKRGRLFPIGIFTFLLNRKKIDGCRVSIIGIKDEFRKLGIAPVLYGRIFEASHRKKLYMGEASYVMENNKVMRKNIEAIGGEVYKKYELYEKDVKNVG